METGDYGVCGCKRCERRRGYPVSSLSWEDMAVMYPSAAEAVRSVSQDAWIICETYSHPEPYAGPKEAPDFGEGKPVWADECLARFPKGRNVFVQWVADNYVKPRVAFQWTNAGTVSNQDRRNIMRAHFSTYWMGGYRRELAIDWIADMVGRSVAHGFDAISLFGEVSPFETGAELNYLALENYGSASNLDGDLDVFLRQTASQLLGGEEYARDYLRYARLLGDRRSMADALKQIWARCTNMPPDVARRWAWLGSYLASFMYRPALQDYPTRVFSSRR